jgi:hypothetical protein
MPVWIVEREILLSLMHVVPSAFKIITKKAVKAIQNRIAAGKRIEPKWPYSSSIPK